MILLDRFRRRPEWEHADPEVRAEGIRQIASGEQDLLAQIARTDTDARVRRAAARRLISPAALAACLADSDGGVREHAEEALLGLAMGQDSPTAETALGALSEPRHLLAAVRSAPLAVVRRSALARIDDARTLATAAKTAEDSALRLEALERVQDLALLLDVALKSEHKDVVVAAVERIDDTGALQAVVARARNKAASRRAQAKLEAHALEPVAAPAEETPAPPPQESSTVESAPVTETPRPPSAEPEAAAPAVVPEPVPEPVAAAATLAPAPPEAKASEARERRQPEQARREMLARMDGLCARLEGLAKAEKLTLHDADAGLREARGLQAELGSVPAKLRQRFKAGRAALFARAQELREADEWSRWANATVQEELCKKLEALVGREDLEQVAHELHECDQRWADARYAPKDEAEALRQRYQAARALVRHKLDAFFARKTAEEVENLKQKEALCVRAEALADSTEWLKASEELKALQARWKQVGPAPRRQAEAVWKRFRSACDRFFRRREQDLKHRKEQWSANLAHKEALIARAEALRDSTDWEAAAQEIRKLQTEWKTVGPVQRKKSEAIWLRFRGACDAFFERYKRRDELAAAERRAEREAICAELEALLPLAGEARPAPESLVERYQALQARLRQGAPLPRGQEEALARRFLEGRNRLVAAYPESFRGTDLDPEAARARKEKLCGRVEALVAVGGEADQGALRGEALARRLKEALAANAIGGAGEAEARRRAEVEEVEAAQAAWRRLGPVPGEAGDALEERFRKACTRFFEQRRVTPRQRRHEAAVG